MCWSAVNEHKERRWGAEAKNWKKKSGRILFIKNKVLRLCSSWKEQKSDRYTVLLVRNRFILSVLSLKYNGVALLM